MKIAFAISPASKIILLRRFKSLAWRAGAMLAIMLVDWTIQNLGLFDMPNSVSIVLGLMLGELSKFLNTNLKELKATNVPK